VAVSVDVQHVSYGQWVGLPIFQKQSTFHWIIFRESPMAGKMKECAGPQALKHGCFFAGALCNLQLPRVAPSPCNINLLTSMRQRVLFWSVFHRNQECALIAGLVHSSLVTRSDCFHRHAVRRYDTIQYSPVTSLLGVIPGSMYWKSAQRTGGDPSYTWPDRVGRNSLEA
jgi:hypothetical protein